MTTTSATLRARWRSRKHVGAAKPFQIVKIQKGRLNRHFAPFVMLDGAEPEFGEVAKGKHNQDPWQAYWEVLGDWIILPNVLSVTSELQFSAEGLADPESITIQMDNLIYQQVVGTVGTYRLIKRGFLSPFYGFRNYGRPTQRDAQGGVMTTNAWFDVLNGDYRVKIWQGYGADAIEPVFVGLIDEVDASSSPDTLTLTARSFQAPLHEQRVFGWAKARDITPPIIFADALRSDRVDRVGGNFKASGSHPGNGPANVGVRGRGTFWLSDGEADPAHTKWIEIHVPKGRYETVYINPEYQGMEAFLSIYCHSDGLGGTDRCVVDDAPVSDGWLDRGLGDVPDLPGVPIARHWRALDKGGQSKHFLFALRCGDNTTIRMSFRNLGRSSYGDYRAKLSRMIGLRRHLLRDAKRANWILVDDATDPIKWMLMWGGFKEWKIDKLGVPLKEPIIFHQSDYLIDIAKHLLADANYVFYTERPSDDDDSLGVPHFVRNSSVEKSVNLQQIKDTDLLTQLQTRFAKEPLAFIIRTRGKMVKHKRDGVVLGEDKTRRVQAEYRPPWSEHHRNVITGYGDTDYPFDPRLSGVMKHETHTDEILETEDECMMSNILIALQMALASYTGTCETAGFPGFGLNEHASVMDVGAGVNTRLWIAHRSTSFTAGERAEYKTTLEGALIDTPDILALALDYFGLLEKVVSERNE